MKKIILFTSTWCGPCKVVKSFLKEKELSVETMDAEENPQDFKNYSVKTVPTLIVLDKDGIILERMSGSEDIINFLKDAKDL